MRSTLQSQLDKNNLRYAVWVNGEIAAMCFRYEQAEELVEMFGDDFDRAIIDLETKKAVFTQYA